MISIVTVCRNAGKDIRKTIESVLSQSNNDFEYIIKDGESSDNTLEIINQYVNKFEEKDVRYHIMSKVDEGIYSAMNQATAECTGDWIIYMNSGDSFYSDDVIDEITSYLKNLSAEVKAVIGKTNYVLHMGLRYIGTPRANSLNDLDFCHQSVFVRREYMLSHKFDEQYRIVADRDQLLAIISDCGAEAIKISDEVVSNYNTRGASQNDFKSTEAEAELLYQKYNICHKKKSQSIAAIKNIVAKICPVLPDLMLVLKKSLK